MHRTLGLVTLMFWAGMAQAAIDSSITNKLTEIGTDAGTLGAAVLVVILAIVAFKYLRRVF